MILDEKCMNYKVVDLTEIYTFFINLIFFCVHMKQ
jgi:hypothetical protein